MQDPEEIPVTGSGFHGLVLRSPEELHYYRIWREAMSSHVSPFLVGRTLDLLAAAARCAGEGTTA